MTLVAPRPGEAARQAIDVLVETGRSVLPERVEYEFDTFTPGKFRRRYKVRISGHQNDYVGLTLQGDRGYVETDSHINALLAQCNGEVVVVKVVD